MFHLVWCYVMELMGEVVRLVFACLSAALFNLLLFGSGLLVWGLLSQTGMDGNFSDSHALAYELLGITVTLTPYWQNALLLAAAAVCGTLVMAVPLQVLGLRRFLFDPLAWPLKVIWAAALTLLLAIPVSHYDGRFAYMEYVYLLFPGMLVVLLPVVRAASHLLPDISRLFDSSSVAGR